MNSTLIAAENEDLEKTSATVRENRAEPQGEVVRAFRINFRRSLISREVGAKYSKEAARRG